MRILVIGDDERIRSFVARCLEQTGFVVDGAVDGETGLEMALHPAYEAVVVDLMLPGMDGLSVIQEMRRQGIRTRCSS